MKEVKFANWINLNEYKENTKKALKDHDKGIYKQMYHLMPPVGWLNDPNGLVQYKGTYHIYYQYAPNDVHNGLKGWGHFQTNDFIHYKSNGMVVYPDVQEDQGGAYSGSAIVKDDTIYYFYTGNVKKVGDYDYIHEGREHNTIVFTSKDGKQMSNKVCLFKNEDYPKDMTCHVRDPKVTKIKDTYYMVLGARDKMDIGCVLLYASTDLDTFEYVTTLRSEEKFGYMWECPDLIEIDNQLFLITCPQGVTTQGYKYERIYQNGYFHIPTDFLNHSMVGVFEEMDLGFDFYAPQSFKDANGRQILIGWMGLPDVDYTNPTTLDGWQHTLTIPRELYVKEGMLCQRAIVEMQDLYGEAFHEGTNLKHNAYRAKWMFEMCQDFEITLRTNTKLVYNEGVLSLHMDVHGFGRDVAHYEVDCVHCIEIYSDISSLEIFINDGVKTMSTRIYDTCTKIHTKASHYSFEGYLINAIEIEENI